MQTSSVYHGFAAQHEALNRNMVELMTKAAEVEAVWLLGLRMEHHRTETLFSVPSVTRRAVSHYWLLVAATASPSPVQLQDKLETHLAPLVPATVIALAGRQFRDWLTAGHPFAAAVHGRGFSLYQKEGLDWPSPTVADSERLAATNARLFVRTKTNVEDFLAGAELYTLRTKYGLAAFLLHQAAEQALRAMMILNTGLRVNTHNLGRLVRYCSLFCYSLQDKFVGTTEKDRRLFRCLQAAYIDSRYAEDYHMELGNLQRLTDRVKALHDLFVQWGTTGPVSIQQLQPATDEQ